MKSFIDQTLGRWLAAWMDAVRPRAAWVLVLAAAAALASGAYTALRLGVNSDGRAMVAEDLEFRRVYDAFAEQFPILDNAILVVVDGETGLGAGRAADRLAQRLRGEGAVFRDAWVVGGGDFFERNALLYLEVEDLQDLADRLAAIQPLLAELAHDGSLDRFVDMVGRSVERDPHGPAAGIDWAPIFERMSRAVEEVLANDADPVAWESMLLPEGVSLSSHRRLIVAEPVLEFDSLLPAAEAIGTVRAAARALELDQDHGVSVRLTGNPVLNYEEMLGIARSVFTAGIASFAVVALILWIGLRSRSLVAGILLTLLFGLLYTAGFATLAVGHLNLISVTFAVLFIGLGVDFGIHLAMRYVELVRAGRPHADALSETARSVGGSLALCAGTTAIGFYVFLPTDYIAVAELGLIAGTGMFVSLFCTLTILPAWLTLVPLTQGARRRDGEDGRARALAAWPFRRAVPIRVVALALGLAALALLSDMRFDPNVVRLRDPSTESVQAFEDLLEDREASPWSIDVVAEDPAAAQALARRLEPLETVGHARVLTDYLPTGQEEKREVLSDVALFLGPRPPDDGEPELPSVGEAIAELGELQSALRTPGLVNGDDRQNAAVARLDALLEQLIARLRSGDAPLRDVAALDESLLTSLRDHVDWLWTAVEPGSARLADLPAPLVQRMRTDTGRARVQVFPSQDLGEPEALARFVEQVRREAPRSTGSAVSLHEYGRTIVDSLEQALVSAAVVIGLLLWVLWRRWFDTAMVLVPLLLAAVLTGAASVLLRAPFNFANVIVLPLLLGIGVDSGIHLVHRWRYEGSRGDLLRSSTARAVLLSAITTVASFGTLAFSAHRGMASLGLLLTAGIAVMLVCNLVVLPALLSRNGKPAPPQAASGGLRASPSSAAAG